MSTLKVNRRELLAFMNSGVAEANGHHTAMTAFMGEPLAVGLILHYLQNYGRRPNAQCISMKVTTGRQKGPRLDAWIFDGEGTLYQTEIKMWGGNAIGGLRIEDGLTPEELLGRSQSQWSKRVWNAETRSFHSGATGQVLEPMQPPRGFEKFRLEPLLALWWLVQPERDAGAWFSVSLADGQHPPFEELHIFSLTRYLMGLDDEILELEMPVLSARLHWLKRIFPE